MMGPRSVKPVHFVLAPSQVGGMRPARRFVPFSPLLWDGFESALAGGWFYFEFKDTSLLTGRDELPWNFPMFA